MKLGRFHGEKEILSYKPANGIGWLTTHHLIIQQEKHNLRINIMESQESEMYMLCDFEKAEVKDEPLPRGFLKRA
jgi:hypothetical protein